MSNSPKPTKPSGVTPETSRKFLQDPSVLAKRHLRFGWWTLLIFLTLGLGLEALHGFKVGMYLKSSNETRRLMCVGVWANYRPSVTQQIEEQMAIKEWTRPRSK